MDVISATSAVSGLLETAIRILGRLRKAYERQKDAARLFDAHTDEIKDLKTMIQIVEDEDSLQTANVTAEILKLRAVEDRLIEWLKRADPRGRSVAHQFSHHLFNGSKEEKRLTEIMADLSRIKADLCMRIQLSSVGVMKNMEKEFVANVEIIKHIDETLIEMFGPNGGLKIVHVLEGRSPRGDGTIVLSDSDLAKIQGKEMLARGDKSDAEFSERIIVGNMCKDQAIQINGPIGADLWKDISRLEVRDNRAEDVSVQVNYITTLDDLKVLWARQDVVLERDRKWQREDMIIPPRKERHDSFLN